MKVNPKNRYPALWAILVSCIMVLAGCAQATSGGNTSAPPASNVADATASASITTTAPTSAPSYKDTVKEIVIAYLPNEATEELAESRGLMSEALSEELGVPVKEFNASDYNAVVEAMRTGKADMAYFGPLTYVDAADRAGAEALVITAPNRDKSLTGYQSLIIVNVNSDIETLEDLRGKDFAFVDPSSTSGNLVPTMEFITAFPEFDNEALHTNGKFFASVMFSGSHQNGLQAVIRGDVHAAPIATDILEREMRAGNVKEEDFRIIHTSPTIPASPMGIRSDLPQDLKDKVLAFLLAYDNDEYFVKMMGQKEDQTIRYIMADDADYDYVRELKARVQ